MPLRKEKVRLEQNKWNPRGTFTVKNPTKPYKMEPNYQTESFSDTFQSSCKKIKNIGFNKMNPKALKRSRRAAVSVCQRGSM